MVESALGPIKTRIKTDIRLLPNVSKAIDTMCTTLGVNRNVLITLASARMCVEYSKMVTSPKKRRTLLRDMRKDFKTPDSGYLERSLPIVTF